MGEETYGVDLIQPPWHVLLILWFTALKIHFAISIFSSLTFASEIELYCRIFAHLRKLLGLRNELEAGFSWTILQRFDEVSGTSTDGLVEQKVDCNSKLAVAFAVMDECFFPIIDRRTGFNLIRHVLYNFGIFLEKQKLEPFMHFIMLMGLFGKVAKASFNLRDMYLITPGNSLSVKTRVRLWKKEEGPLNREREGKKRGEIDDLWEKFRKRDESEEFHTVHICSKLINLSPLSHTLCLEKLPLFIAFYNSNDLERKLQKGTVCVSSSIQRPDFTNPVVFITKALTFS
ncbi:hypothetical protein ACLOJK_005814 [Asimina triloba]